MSNPVFPTLTARQDSKFYEMTPEDPALRSEMEGGYVVSRPRHTRKPRRTFKTGFSSITQADYVKLTDFYDTVRGGSMVFDWMDPVTEKVYQVRFAGAISFKYVGMGPTKLWDVQITLEQA